MWNWSVSDEKYTQLYHQYFAEFLSGVGVEGIISNAYDLIKDYVAKDPTAFYSCEEFELGGETLWQFCTLRSESISMQLENDETTSDMSYVDASAIILSDMGSMGGGMGDMSSCNGAKSGNERLADQTVGQTSATDEASTAISSEGMAGDKPLDMPEGFSGNMPDDLEPSNQPEGEMPENFEPSDPSDGLAGETAGQPSDDFTDATPPNSSDAGGDAVRPFDSNMQMPQEGLGFDKTDDGIAPSDTASWIWLASSMAMLFVGLIVAKKYKR